MKWIHRLSNWCYKWLPILMGCHCRPERSFHYKGRPFPICARCTGMLAGFIFALMTFPFLRISAHWLLLFILPGVIDGTIQMFSSYESTNIRRLVTGFFMGYGLLSLIMASFIFTFHIGTKIGESIKNR